MKNMKWIMAVVSAFLLLVGVMAVRAGDTNEVKTAKPKPYPLDTCLVCDMKLGDMGKPYVFVYKGQEIKVCDKSEEADFKKDPKKYMKKLAEEEAKLKKSPTP